MEIRTCCQCQEEKPITEFSPNGKRKGTQQYRSACRTCYNEMMLRNHHLRKAGRGTGGPHTSPIVDGRKRCPHCKMDKSIEDFLPNLKNGRYQAWCKRCTRDARLHQLYGISIDEYDRLFAAQNGVCAVCRRPERSQNQYGLVSLSVDHDHRTGKVRGLLCVDCNRAIGQLGDDVLLLRAAVDYLERFRT